MQNMTHLLSVLISAAYLISGGPWFVPNYVSCNFLLSWMLKIRQSSACFRIVCCYIKKIFISWIRQKSSQTFFAHALYVYMITVSWNFKTW